MNELFTSRRTHLRIGLLSLALFSSARVLSILAAYAAPANRKLPAALFMGIFWSCWVGLSVWSVLAYFKESVTLGDADVRFTHLLFPAFLAFFAGLRKRQLLKKSQAEPTAEADRGRHSGSPESTSSEAAPVA